MHFEINAIAAITLKQCRRYNMIRVCILWQLYCFGAPQELHLIVYKLRQPGFGLRYDVPAVAGHKARFDDCTVFIFDLTVTNNMVHPHSICLSRKRRQRRSEQEERNSTIEIESADSGQDRKRRVVQHHSTLWIIEALIIAARVEWAHNFSWVDSIFIASPVPYDRVHAGRCIAIIRGLFGLELFNKLLVRFAERHALTSQ